MDDFRQVTSLDHATSDDTVRLARAAAEAIRGMNHLTRHDTGMDQPSAAYDIIAALSLAASRLPQLLTQVERWLERALAARRLGHDCGEDPASAVEATAIFLSDARASAAALAGDLSQAQQQLAPVNGTPRPAGRQHQDQS